MRSLLDGVDQELRQAASGKPVRLPAKGGKEHGLPERALKGPALSTHWSEG